MRSIVRDKSTVVQLFEENVCSKDALICQMTLFVRCSHFKDAPICQTPLLVRFPYLSDSPISLVAKVVRNNRRPFSKMAAENANTLE